MSSEDTGEISPMLTQEDSLHPVGRLSHKTSLPSRHKQLLLRQWWCRLASVRE